MNMKKIEELAKKFGTVEAINKEQKRVASEKCRLQKKKFLKTYEADMKEILAYYNELKEAKNLLDPKEKFVTEFDLGDVKKLDYTQTMKAIKSIQSKKTNTRLDEYGNDATEKEPYQNAIRIEAMLLEHKATLKPVSDGMIRKSDLQNVIDAIEIAGTVSQEKILDMLKELL